METEDIKYMNRAIRLAEQGLGWVNPNPLVGAVIVIDGQIIGEGWHERYGGLHAERSAFKNCIGNPRGATLYVTLEPCCHYGKTPPCTEAIIENGIHRVVVGMTDPNPLVAGKGIKILKEAGIEVIVGIEEDQIREQNRVFIKYITTRLPWVVMKTAMTLDGKIATYTGDSHWVTGNEARDMVQKMRRSYMGIMVGIGTVKADNPMLNYRLAAQGRQPIRIVVDSAASIGVNCLLVETAREIRTIIVHTDKAPEDQLAALLGKGVELLLCVTRDGKVDVGDMMQKLGRLGVDALLLEGGGQLNEACLQNGFVDEVYAFIAPKIVGGENARTPVEGRGIATMKEAICLGQVSLEQVGEDILVKGRVVYNK